MGANTLTQSQGAEELSFAAKYPRKFNRNVQLEGVFGTDRPCGTHTFRKELWWTWRGSNPRPHDCQKSKSLPGFSPRRLFFMA